MKRAIRWLLWIALAVMLALLLRVSEGFVVLQAFGKRIELAFNLFLILLVALVILAYFAMRGIALLRALPKRVEAARQEKRERTAREQMFESVELLLAGKHAEAERAASQAEGWKEGQPTGRLIEAAAALAAGRPAATFERMAPVAKDVTASITTLVLAAESALQIGRIEDALRFVNRALEREDTLPRALAIKYDACTRLGRWDEAIAVLHKWLSLSVLSHERAEALRAEAIHGVVEASVDADALLKTFKRWPPPLREHAVTVMTVASRLSALNRAEDARRLVEDQLARQWDSGLSAYYGEIEGDTLAMLKRAEAWLPAYPRDAGLLKSLGLLCARHGLRGKAVQYFEASLSLRHDNEIAHLADALRPSKELPAPDQPLLASTAGVKESQ